MTRPRIVARMGGLRLRVSPWLAGAVGLLVGVSVALLFAPNGTTSTIVSEPGASGLPGTTTGGAHGGATGAAGVTSGGSGSTTGSAPGSTSGGLATTGGSLTGGTTGTAATTGSTTGTTTSAGAPLTLRGVTDKVIRIGIAAPDLSAVGALGPGYDDGDPEKQAASVLAAWKRDGLLPVHGRTVVFSYKSFNILSDAAARSACTGLIDDDHSFMVIANHTFSGPGADCVTKERHAPLVTAEGVNEAEQQMDAPYYFTTQMSESRLLRNWPYWADAHGLLKGKRIGLYYFTSEKQHVFANLKASLVKLGYGKNIVSEVTSTTEGGGPSDSVAARKFQRAHVNLAWLVVDQLSQTNFMNAALANLYHPTYIGSDYRLDSTNTATMTFPPSEYGGTYGMTGMRVGEAASGMPEPAVAKKCVANYRKYTGVTVDRQKNEAEYVSLQDTCDEGRLVMYALQHAGRNLTPTSFVAALQKVRNLPMGISGNVSYGPGIYAGTNTQRTIQWQATCKCWHALGRFTPLYVE